MTGPIAATLRIDDDPDGQASLFRWLTQDPQVRRDVTVTLDRPVAAGGEMGALDLINVVLSNGIAVGGLIVAIVSWRRARPAPPVVRLERDGVSIVIEDASPETVRRVVEALGDRPEPPGGDETDGAS